MKPRLDAESKGEHEVRKTLSAAVEGAGLAGRWVEVHASMRSFSERVDADDLLHVFDATQLTSLFPAFSHVFHVIPDERAQLAANGYLYGAPTVSGAVPEYRREHGDISPDLGVLPRVALQRGAIRGDHPFNAFCALGPHAASVTAAQTPNDTYGPVREAAAADGMLLLIGVGLERATCIHHAERLAGREQFTRWYSSNGVIVPAITGGCSAAFGEFNAHITPGLRVECHGSTWQVFNLATIIDEITAAVVANPYLGLCDRPHCDKCRVGRSRVARRG
jgi:aminoglycoside 3-N-acetyltransferase